MSDQGQFPALSGLALARLWGTEAATRPGPRPKISLEQIVEAAVHLAHAEGLAAVSMAQVAQTAGCAKMALYRHVSGRHDLLSAMLDHALGDPPHLAGSWQQRFTVLWDALLGLYADHPWLLELPSDTPGLTPRNVAWIDASLSLFSGSTLPVTQRLNTVLLLTENIRFDARRRQSGGHRVDDLDQLFSSASEATDWLPAQQFPHLAATGSAAATEGTPSADTEPIREVMLRAIAVYFPEEPQL